MSPSLSAVAVGVARAVDMVAVAVQLLAVAALPGDRTGVVEAGAEVAEKARAATPATSIAASLVPAFIRMPCSIILSPRPHAGHCRWLVRAPARVGAGPRAAAVPSGASAVPAAAARTDPTPGSRRPGGLRVPLAAGITPQPSTGSGPGNLHGTGHLAACVAPQARGGPPPDPLTEPGHSCHGHLGSPPLWPPSPTIISPRQAANPRTAGQVREP